MFSLRKEKQKRLIVAPVVILHKPFCIVVYLVGTRTDLIFVLYLDLLVRPPSLDYDMSQILIRKFPVNQNFSLNVRGRPRLRNIAEFEMIKSRLSHIKFPCDLPRILCYNPFEANTYLAVCRCRITAQIDFHALA